MMAWQTKYIQPCVFQEMQSEGGPELAQNVSIQNDLCCCWSTTPVVVKSWNRCLYKPKLAKKNSPETPLGHQLTEERVAYADLFSVILRLNCEGKSAILGMDTQDFSAIKAGPKFGMPSSVFLVPLYALNTDAYHRGPLANRPKYHFSNLPLFSLTHFRRKIIKTEKAVAMR